MRFCLREATYVSAIVGMSHGIYGFVGGIDIVGVTVAVFHPLDGAVIPTSRERSLEVTAGAKDISGAIYMGAIGGQAKDRCVGSPVTNQAVRGPW